MRARDLTDTTSKIGAHKRAEARRVETALAALESMDAADLRTEWTRLYRYHLPKRLSRDLLELGVAWKLQERAFGGLSAVTKRQIAQLSRTIEAKADLAKVRTVSLRPGVRLIRE